MKKLITIVLTALLLAVLPLAASANTYKDVRYDHWAYQDIEFMTKHKVIRGFSDGQFRPGQTITRKDAAVMMVRALEMPPAVYLHPVTDMKPTSPGYLETQIAIEEDWFTLRDGAFQPDAILTRDEMAKALATAFSYRGNGQSKFTDVPWYHEYYPYIDAILTFEVTEGYNDNTYRPHELVTRAQFSAFMSRVFHQPIAYEVRQDGVVQAVFPSMDEAIRFAATVEMSTIHPQDNRYMNFAQELSTKNRTDIQKGVLIYNGLNENDQFTTDFYNSYLSYTDANWQRQKMFDSFIILGLRYPGGQFAENNLNNANYEDYVWYLDRTYQRDGALHVLNEAARNQNDTVDVYLTIPYPKRSGTITLLNGQTQAVDTYTRSDLTRWYVDQTLNRFQAQGFTNINLKGFYWLNETVKVDDDGALLASLTSYVHRKQLDIVYAPHATSTNFKKWDRYGFDAAFLQPNAFRTATPDKEARLHKAFVNAQIYGSGITLEVNSYGPNQVEEGQEAWDMYMNFAERYKLAETSFLFYQDRDMIHRMRTYSQPATYQLWYKDILTTLFAPTPETPQ